jgi:DNA-binding transcriptional LysR family regulator
MDRFKAMRVFVAAAGAGSLSAAARQLGQPLTTVSRQLADLEAHVGTTLLARTTRTMALTSAGKIYLETCRRVLEEIDESERRIANRPGELRGEIALTAPVMFGRLHVLPVAVDFLERHPGVTARLSFADRVVDLIEDGFDAALRIGPLPNSTLVATKVGALRYVTCASPGYIRKYGAPETPSSLKAHACIGFSSLPGGVRWVFKSVKHGRSAVRIEPRLNVDSVEAAIEAASGGLGVTRLLSYQAAAHVAQKRLSLVLSPYDDCPVPVHFVQRSLRHAKPHVRAFAMFAADKLRKRLA